MTTTRLYITLALAALLLGTPACNTTQSEGTPHGSALGSSQATNAVSSPVNSTSDMGECDNEFYPVVKGASWTYTMTGGITGEFTRSIVDTMPTAFTDQVTFSTGMTRIGKWQCDDGDLTAMQADVGVTASVQLNNRDDNFQTSEVDGLNIPDQLAPGVTWSEALRLEGTRLVNGAEVPASDAIKLDCAAANPESISVPAGVFKAIRSNCRTDEKVTLSVTGIGVPTDTLTISTVWYASGVGMVKAEQVTANGPKTTIKLSAYKIP